MHMAKGYIKIDIRPTVIKTAYIYIQLEGSSDQSTPINDHT